MKSNIGHLDKVFRLGFALLVALLYLLNVIDGWLAVALGAVALVMIITAVTGVCGLYAACGLNTKAKNTTQNRTSK